MQNGGKYKIAFQGCRGAFSHRAVLRFAEDLNLVDDVECVSCESFAMAFERLIQGECDFAVVPLENSSVGSIVGNYDLLWSHPVTIVSEVYLPIHHNLLGFQGTEPSSIKEIYSHPVALEQCRKLLKRLSNAKSVAFWDTSASAFHVKESGKSEWAAIASELAAQESGLAVLEKNIEDHGGNNTRFAVVSGSVGLDGRKANGALNLVRARLDIPLKISCAVELPHKPGSLAELLSRMARHGVNLTKIESRPIPETPWHYRFFLDIEILKEDQIDPLIRDIQSLTETHKIFGTYKSWAHVMTNK